MLPDCQLDDQWIGSHVIVTACQQIVTVVSSMTEISI